MTGVRLDGVQPSRVAFRRPAAGAVLAALLLGYVVSALAVERPVAVTADGLSPGELTISPDDMVVRVNQDPPLRRRATSTSGNGTLDSGLVALGPGQRFPLPQVTQPRAYAVTALRGQEAFDGAVVLPAESAQAAFPGPVPRQGEGEAALPPALGGSDAASSVSVPSLAGTAPPPARLAVAGGLPGPGSPRGLGLPAVLAAVLVLGVASLLVRVLLAEPAARRRAADPS